ncbi:MAG TPA: hypothetical protein VGO55_03515 [Allosphingosinicella sp.]|jgi:hypothetical protein|nr:hypothetical protein [Allosphingosinicella sp.]
MTPAQLCPQWCWAACIEATFGLHNRPVGQQAIVNKLFGGTPCVPAQSPQIFAAINGGWLDAYGRPFQAMAEVIWDNQAGIAYPNSRSIIVSDLINGFPLINGAVGHATVVTSVQYAPTFPEPTILGVIVRDPWPMNPNRRALSSQEVAGTGFMARVRVS